MFTTLRQVPVNNVSLLFLIQSWLALTLAFASVYLFLQQALGVGLTADLNSTLYHTAFGSVCIVGENSTLPGRSRIEGCLSLFVSNYDQVCTLCVCLAGIRIFLYNDLVVLLLSSSPSRIRSISHWLMSSTT
jgi:hypothetical protein